MPVARSQSLFSSVPSELETDGSRFVGAYAFFKIGTDSSEFDVAIVDPFLNGSFLPVIATPLVSQTFSLGSGELQYYYGCDEFPNPFLPPITLPGGIGCPAITTGTHYSGSFHLSPGILAELLVGHGEFRLTSDSGTLLSDHIVSVPQPTYTAPQLVVSRGETNTLVLSWSAPFGVFTLQRNSDLNATNWTNLALDSIIFQITVDSENKVVIPEPSGNVFYRLSSQ